MIGVASALAGYGAVLVISECCHRFFNGRLISRKIAHVGAGIVTATLPFLVELPVALCFSIVFTILIFISQRYHLVQSIDEHGGGLGGVYFPIGMGLAALFFWDTPTVFSGAVVLFALPDGVSGYVGKRFGHNTYSFTGTKTIEGSAAFFVSALMVFFVWASLCGLTLTGMFLWEGMGLALFLTLAEGVLGKGTDNLFLPVLAGGLLTLFV